MVKYKIRFGIEEWGLKGSLINVSIFLNYINFKAIELSFLDIQYKTRILSFFLHKSCFLHESVFFEN